MGKPPLSNREEPMAHEKLSTEHAAGVPKNHIESHLEFDRAGLAALLSFG